MHHKILFLLLIPILFCTVMPRAKATRFAFNSRIVNHVPKHHYMITKTYRKRSYRPVIKPRINHRQYKPEYNSMANRMYFYSQQYPRYSSSCESASLLMALSIKHKSHNMSLYKFNKKKVGWFNSGNSAREVNYRYNRDPYRQSATIYPRGLQRAARRMGAKSKVIDHASKHKIIYYLMHNDPIAAEASYHLEIWVANHSRQSDHIICLIGYKRTKNGHEYIQYADPYYKHRNQGIRWGTMTQFLESYRRPITGERALVVLT